MRTMLLVVSLFLSSLVFAAEPPKVDLTPPAVATPAVAAPALPTATPVVEPVKPAVTLPKTALNLDTNKDGKVSKEEIAAAVNEPDPKPAEIVKEVAAVVAAGKELGDKDVPKSLAIAIFLGALFKLLLSLVKVLGNHIAWFKTPDGKRVIKYSTLGLGAVAGLCANLGFGMNWIEAVTIMLSGPLAVAIHEYTSDSKADPAPAPAPVAVTPDVTPPVDPPKSDATPTKV